MRNIDIKVGNGTGSENSSDQDNIETDVIAILDEASNDDDTIDDDTIDEDYWMKDSSQPESKDRLLPPYRTGRIKIKFTGNSIEFKQL